MEKRFSLDEVLDLDRFFRMHLINTASGYHPAFLIGTLSHRRVANAAVFNSVVHLGATPPYLGFIVRPLTVPRHTYHNIKANRSFTINHIHEDMLRQAHQTSANYPAGTSEFEAAGLTPQFTETLAAPYVQESHIKIGLEYEEEHHIRANDTLLIVGKVVEIILPAAVVADSGHINLAEAGSLAVAGLDTYYRGQQLTRLGYARPEKRKE